MFDGDAGKMSPWQRVEAMFKVMELDNPDKVKYVVRSSLPDVCCMRIGCDRPGLSHPDEHMR